MVRKICCTDLPSCSFWESKRKRTAAKYKRLQLEGLLDQLNLFEVIRSSKKKIQVLKKQLNISAFLFFFFIYLQNWNINLRFTKANITKTNMSRWHIKLCFLSKSPKYSFFLMYCHLPPWRLDLACISVQEHVLVRQQNILWTTELILMKLNEWIGCTSRCASDSC